jgi:KTSC domain
MIRTPLKSSKLRAAGFDERLRVMEIEFVNGDIYEYRSVSPEVFRQLLSSPSPNSFFEDKIEEAFSGKRIGVAKKSAAADDFDALFGARSSDG